MPSPSSPASKATLNHNSYNNTLNGINSTNSMNNNYYQPPQNTYDRQSGSPIGYQPPPPPNHPPPQPSSLPRSYSSPISPSTTLRHNSTLPSSSASIRSEKSSSSSRLQKIAQTRHRIYKNPFRKYNDDGTLRFLTYREIEMKGLGELAQFSNERLYLHWIRFGVLQGGIAVMLLSFGIGVAAYVGVGALLLTSMTLVYATTLYHKRHLYMRAKRQDVDYYARTTPTLLTLGLLVLYAANFALQLSFGEEARSPPPWTADDKGNYKNV
ncbi:hypothetical protein BGZ83_010793 [Gryganskiella cystojenkinii]|nr:hypothetical protein BGZ83_010793 [Gryganskiella cystojenkinii]